MPNYRRFTVPGATVFFTVVTHERRRFLTDPLARRCLRAAFQVVRARYPFEIPAMVLLPDHLHALWVLPPGDSSYAMRWRRIKEEFTERFLSEGGEEGRRSASRELRKERGVWQRRVWEHTILDDGDFERHCDYIHYNPVKHGLVACPRDWACSSFQRWVRRQVYPSDWGCSSHAPPTGLDSLNDTAME
jgi:putative transposase